VAAGGPWQPELVAVLVWVTEAGWTAAVEGALRHSDAAAELVLLHVVPGDLDELPQTALSGLVGRDRQQGDPVGAARRLAELSADELLAAAAGRARNRPVRPLRRRGRPEREVVAAAAGMDLLVLARDGDDGQPGPRSLGPQARFVVDHAPCPVLLVWPAVRSAGDPLPRPRRPPR
jgi:nucleotide-binding universal stress UspA family protein